jgi:thymidylate synthase
MLWLSEAIKPIGDMDEIKGAFERIEPHDIELLNYQSHEAIKAPMAA